MTPDEMYEEADRLDTEARLMIERLQDYIDDVEHEADEMQFEAQKLREQAAEIVDSQ